MSIKSAGVSRIHPELVKLFESRRLSQNLSDINSLRLCGFYCHRISFSSCSVLTIDLSDRMISVTDRTGKDQVSSILEKERWMSTDQMSSEWNISSFSVWRMQKFMEFKTYIIFPD